MYVNTSFGCRTQGQEGTVGWFSALSPVRNFSTDSSVGTYWNSVFFYLGTRDVPVANSVEKFLTRPIPGVPFSMVNGHRELSQLDPLHIAFAGGRREILHACSRFMNS